MKRIFRIFTYVFLINFSYSQQNSNIIVNQWVVAPPQNPDAYPLIYVDFWATWCAPCISAMPYTEELEKRFGNDILFLYLSNEPAGKVEEFMKRFSKKFISAVNPTGETFDRYEIRHIPQSLILGPAGEVVWRGKPLELEGELLEALLKKYRRQDVRPGRVRLQAGPQTSEKWNLFTQDDLPLQYYPDARVSNEVNLTPGHFYLSGDLAFIAPIVKDVPLPYIRNTLPSLPKYRFASTVDDPGVFRGLVQSFICRETPYKIEEFRQTVPVYVLEDGQNENLFSKEMYDFEKGNNVPLIDETGMMIDNATKGELADWLTYVTGKYFIYKGQDTTRYDWNLQHTPIENLLRQLSEEYRLPVRSTQTTLTFYRLKRKP